MKVSGGNIRKAPSSETVPCKYRGAGVECPKLDARSGCTKCGWNAVVEMNRIEEIKKQPIVKRPDRRLIFTKQWEWYERNYSK